MEIPIDLDLTGLSLPRDEPVSTEAVDHTLALISAAQGGCEVSFRELVALHQNAIHRFCFHWLRDPEDAQEACQDTFVRAWHALDRFENRGLFSNWLYRIALNICRDRHKSKASRQRRETRSLGAGESPLACHRPGPDESLARAGDLEKLSRGIALLPERLRVVLILCAQEGLSQDECAEVLNCSIRAVEGRLYRARRELLAWWSRTD